MSSEEKGNNVSKSSEILGFLDATETILERGMKYIKSRFPPVITDRMVSNTTVRPFIQGDKKKYAIALTVVLILDEDEIVQICEDLNKSQDDISRMMRDQIEKEKLNADKYLRRREIKLRKIKSKY